MTYFSRLFSATALVCAAMPAAAETWRLSSMMTPESFEGQAYERFAELVDEYSEGDLTIRIYPSEQIGSMDTVVEQLSQNIIQIAPSAVSFMSRWEGGIRYATAPFLFDDYDHWSNFVNGALFQEWLTTVEADARITILGNIPDMPRGTFRTLLSVDPIETAADIGSIRMRQFQDELVIEGWETLGAEVRVLPWGEVYDGINRGIVNAVTSPAELIQSMRFYEVAPNIIRTDEYPQAVAWMMNADAWESLSPELQAVVTQAHQEAAAYARELLAAEAATLVSDLEAIDGVTVNFDFDTSTIVATMADFYAEHDAAGTLPDGLLDAVEAARAE